MSIGAPAPLSYTWTRPWTVVPHSAFATAIARGGTPVVDLTTRLPPIVPPSTKTETARVLVRLPPIVAPESTTAPPACTVTLPATAVLPSVHVLPFGTVRPP